MDMFEYEDARLILPGRSGMAWIKGLSLLAVFVLCLSASAVLVKTWLRQQPEFLEHNSYIYAKFHGLALQEYEPDALFVGASLAHRHLNPTIFQAHEECQSRNIDIFNFGVGGASDTNIRFMLDWAAKNTSKSVLFFEFNTLQLWQSATSSYGRLYAPTQADQIWGRTLPRREPGLDGLFHRARDLSELVLAEQYNVGAWHMMQQADPASHDVQEVSLLIGERGFQGLEQILAPDHPRRRALARLLAETPDAMRETLEAREAQFAELTALQLEAAVVEEVGPILLGLPRDVLERLVLIASPPSLLSQAEIDAVTLAGVRVPVITTPLSSLPALGKVSNWIDPNHMGMDGAELYSRHIAPEVCAILAQRDPT